MYLETEPGERDEQPEHPLKRSWITRIRTCRASTCGATSSGAKHISGNAYLRKIRAGKGPGGNVLELWPVSPTRIQPVTTKEDAARGVFISYYAYVFDPYQPPEQVPPEDIVHFRLGIDDKDNRMGASPLARLVREVAGDEEAHKWQKAMLANGGTVGMLIQVPEDSSMTVEQAEDMKTAIRGAIRRRQSWPYGCADGRREATPYGFSPEQMDMKALHRIPEERIAAVLRVPAIIAGLGAGLDRSTYANFREAREMFAEMTLMPLYSFDAATLNMQLTPEFTSDRKIRVMFDVSDLRAFQEDETEKYKRLDLAVKTGWIRPNEARTDVGLPPDMDDEAFAAAHTAVTQVVSQGKRTARSRKPYPSHAEKHAASHPSRRKHEQMPEILQALVDLAEPATTKQLDGYLDQQRRRVKRALVG